MLQCCIHFPNLNAFKLVPQASAYTIIHVNVTPKIQIQDLKSTNLHLFFIT